jgi:hypothetical protein
MGVARWEWEQSEAAAKRRAGAATNLKRVHLELSQAEAAARMQVIQTEVEARNAEIQVLALASGQASRVLVNDRAVLRKMRHADSDEDVRVQARGTNGTQKRNGHTNHQ